MKNQNKLSNLFNLDYVDVGYGVITSAVTGGLTALYNALNQNIVFDFHHIAIASAIGGLSYVLKRFASNSDGQLLIKDQYKNNITNNTMENLQDNNEIKNKDVENEKATQENFDVKKEEVSNNEELMKKRKKEPVNASIEAETLNPDAPVYPQKPM